MNKSFISATNDITLSSLTDEELVKKSNELYRSDIYTTELICRYFPMIKAKANAFCRSISPNNLALVEDFTQEGLMGFLNAIRHFDVSNGAKFSTFASVCVQNRMKNTFSDVSQTASLEDLSEDVPDYKNPEFDFIEKEVVNDLRPILTKREFEVAELLISGMSYKDIAKCLNITVKSVDSALQRARKKLRSSYEEQL